MEIVHSVALQVAAEISWPCPSGQERVEGFDNFTAGQWADLILEGHQASACQRMDATHTGADPIERRAAAACIAPSPVRGEGARGLPFSLLPSPFSLLPSPLSPLFMRQTPPSPFKNHTRPLSTKSMLLKPARQLRNTTQCAFALFTLTSTKSFVVPH